MSHKTKKIMKIASTNLGKDRVFKRFFSLDLMLLRNRRLLFERRLVDFSEQFRLPVFAGSTAPKAAAGNGQVTAFDLLFFVLEFFLLLFIQSPSLLEFIQLLLGQFLQVW
jgi:hypothetical protein